MIKYYLGIESDYILIGVAGVTILLFIFILINIIQMHKLKKKYKIGKGLGDSGRSLRNTGEWVWL